MVKFNKAADQGEMFIFKNEHINGDFERMEPEGNHYILAHSETRHHHVIDRDKVDVYKRVDTKVPEGVEILKLIVKEPTEIRHLRSFDTHEPLEVEPGEYEIRLAREYTPKGYRRVMD